MNISLSTSLAACRAHEEWGWRAEHERQRVRVVSRALLPTPALFHSPAATSGPVLLPVTSPSPRPQSSTATSPEARRGHAGRRRRAEARATTRQRCRSCSAGHSCPLPLARRALRPRRRPPTMPAPSNLNSDEPGGSSRTPRTRVESRARATARLRRLSCSAARPCPALLHSPIATTGPVLLLVPPGALGAQR